MLPGWLSFFNGLVAPGFIMCAGYSLVLSTFKPDGGMRPFAPTAKRLGFILFCAYALHAPSLSLAGWTVHRVPQAWSILCQIDVLQCIVYSLLILHGLARLIRRPLAYAAVALVLAPHVWQPGVADGWWPPIRGLINGNPDQGVGSLFPLFPWFSFAAFGSVLGALYRHFRVMPHAGIARWSEPRWLLALALLGGALFLWGTLHARNWLDGGPFPASDSSRLYNMTLPSVAERLGIVCAAGATMGWLEMIRGRWRGPNWVLTASRESLLLYMLHLNLIFGLLLAPGIRARTGWEPLTLGWQGTLTLAAALIAVNLAAGAAWQIVRNHNGLDRKIRNYALIALAAWFVAGGWGA
jgi:hypothetical protein